MSETTVKPLPPGRRRLAPALTAASAVALAAGLVLPVMRFPELLGPGRTYSVAGGVLALWRGGERPLATLIFLFSMVLPVVKILALAAACRPGFPPAARRALLRGLEVVGRWSMLDVFVVVVLVGSLKLWFVDLAVPEPGIYVFTGAVLLSVLATFVLLREAPEEARPRPRPPPPGARLPTAVLGLVALGFLAGGVLLPFLTVTKWAFLKTEYSVVEAALELFDDGDIGLSLLVFAAVVGIPAARIAVLLVPVLAGPARGLAPAARWLSRLGMADVFALAAVVTIVRLSGEARVEAQPGAWMLFAGVVLSPVFCRAARAFLPPSAGGEGR